MLLWILGEHVKGCHTNNVRLSLGSCFIKEVGWNTYIYICVPIECLCQGFPYGMGSLKLHIPVLYTHGMYEAYVITVREYPKIYANI